VVARAGTLLLGLACVACRTSAAEEGTRAVLSSAPVVEPVGPSISPTIAPGESCRPLRFEPPSPGSVEGLDPPLVDVEDPHGTLAPFFQRFARVVRGRAQGPVRIGVYGDSNGTMDYMTGEMRRVLQTSFGDAGHGFMALARPWKWYRHQYVVADYMHDAWSAFTVTTHPTPAMDPWYGPGLIVAQSHQTGAATWIATAPEGAPVGTHVTRLEAWYLKWPPGGAFDVRIDGEVRASADTRAEGEPHFGFVAVDVPDGPHRMMMVTKSARPVRLLGAVLERQMAGSQGGFQVDGLGVGSLNCLCVLRESEELDREIFAHRPYDLVVFHIGSNTWNPAVLDPVECMTSVIARLRRAMPGTSILLMTPPDWGLDGAKKTPPWLKKAEAQLHQASVEGKTAFFDFRSAMGGEGSMARFQQLRMTQGDGVHFNARGGEFVGERVVDALVRSFARWADATPRAGCE
jgi:hypothetical protein